MFDIRGRGSTVGREVLGGVTTFMAMSYILFVQPAVLGKTGMDAGGVFMATCLASAAACLLMGLLANYPIALAPGMGENFFFALTLCGAGAAAGGFALNWQEGLALTAVAGLLFLLLSLVGFRSMIVNAIPDALKSGIAAGIGLFIALIGFEWGNLVRPSPVTCVEMASMKGNYVALLTLVGLAATLALAAFRVRGAILIGLLLTTALTWGAGQVGLRPDLGLAVSEAAGGLRVDRIQPNSAAEAAGAVQLGDVIVRFDGQPVHRADALQSAWRAAGRLPSVEVELLRGAQALRVEQPLVLRTIEFRGLAGVPGGLSRTAGGFARGLGSLGGKLLSEQWVHVLAFGFILLFMDLFDTVGTLVGVAQRAGLIRNNRLPGAERALAADAAGTVIGAALGTSTVTSYIESITGVSSGARTGLAAIVTGLCLLLALLFQPLVTMVGGGVKVGALPWGDPILRYPMIAPALIVVGSMMMRAMRDIEWDDVTEALPGFLAMVAMPFAYSISAGIAIGFVSYAFGKLLTGRPKQCPIVVYVFAALFVIQYLLGR